MKVFGAFGNHKKICIGVTTNVIRLKLRHHTLEKGTVVFLKRIIYIFETKLH